MYAYRYNLVRLIKLQPPLITRLQIFGASFYLSKDFLLSLKQAHRLLLYSTPFFSLCQTYFEQQSSSPPSPPQ